MKNDNMILIAAALLGLMLYSKQAGAAGRGLVTPTTPKPAQQGASLATMGQYWTNLLGPVVGSAVAQKTFTYDAWAGSALVKDQQAADAAQLASFTPPEVVPTADDSNYWGIE
jgi:hypothetical protein